MSRDVTEIDVRIAERLRALRISKGVTTAELATAIGTKSNTITMVENGRTKLSATQLVTLAQSLGVLTSVLVGEAPADGGAA